MMIFPRTFCTSFLLTVVMLFGSTSGLAQTSNTDSPAAAQSQVGQGQAAQLEGQLEIVYQDFKDHSRLSYSLKQSDGTRVPLQFTKQPPTHLLTGDHVQVSGQRSGSGLILYSGSTNIKKTGGGGSSSCTADSGQTCSTASSIPVPNTFGAQSTLIILVNFQDDVVEPYTVADAQNAYFGTANNFSMENSYGQTSLTGTVVGWYTIPDSVTTCNTSQIATDAQSAATANGVNLSNYTRYVYLFPQDDACGFGGASTVGGNPSQNWLNGTLDPHTVNHELGHGLGLWHSHSLDCGTTATICSSGTIQEYGDQVDVMGSVQGASPDYNAFQKERLGWLNYGASPSIQTVTASGTYTITPYENGPGPNALKVFQSTNSTTGAKTWYYLESRQAIGFDAFLTTWPYGTTENETTGVLLHLGTDGDGNSSLMLNMTPAASNFFDFEMSLAVGQSFNDPTAGVTFTTQSVTSAGATVSVQLSNSPNPSPQTVGTLTVATNQANYSPGQTVSVTATATNAGSPVANVSVSFAITNPNGSNVKASATTGNNGQAVYKLKLKQTAPAGTYVAGAAATAVSASTDFTVQ